MTVLLGQARERTCRGCGCTDSHACVGGCCWVLLDVDAPSGICSACAQGVEWDQAAFVLMGREGEWQDEVVDVDVDPRFQSFGRTST